MEILGIGMQELLFIILIAIIVLGPRDMQKAGQTLGRWLRDLTTSDAWKVFQQTSRELRALPTRLMREAQFEDLDRELHQTLDPRPGPPRPPEPPPEGDQKPDA
jgi:Sec-independent protein translocase protein TatA